MARKREPQHDWICRRCECPCDPPLADAKHIGGGQGMRSCRRLPVPVLRREFEAEMAAMAAEFTFAVRSRVSARAGRDPSGSGE